jgi:hypothetical protein
MGTIANENVRKSERKGPFLRCTCKSKGDIKNYSQINRVCECGLDLPGPR